VAIAIFELADLFTGAAFSKVILEKIPCPVFAPLKTVSRLCPFCAHGKKIGADFCQLAPSAMDSRHIEIACK
jgi:hypothetical protein